MPRNHKMKLQSDTFNKIKAGTKQFGRILYLKRL